MSRPGSIDEYIATFPPDVRPTLEDIRQTIRRALPEAQEAISYQIPAFMVQGGYVVYFAGWKGHVSIYPIPAADEALLAELAPYRARKGTLRFPLGKPVPHDLVARVASALLTERLARRSR